tara:strand:+ start:28851 stop:29315 length:465 start_codon:yes stop_codon:yes gene_type:complete
MNNKVGDSTMIDMMYLINPNSLEKIKIKNDIKNVDKKKLKKYKKKVLKITEQLLNNENENKSTNVINSFFTYFEKILEDEFLKNKVSIIQSQYDNETKKKKKKVTNMDVNEMDINLLGKKEKKEKTIGLDNYVKKKKVKKKKKVYLPKTKKFDN